MSYTPQPDEETHEETHEETPREPEKPAPAVVTLGELTLLDQHLKLNGMPGLAGFLGQLASQMHGVPSPPAASEADASKAATEGVAGR
jgi:hypothetical protein